MARASAVSLSHIVVEPNTAPPAVLMNVPAGQENDASHQRPAATSA